MIDVALDFLVNELADYVQFKTGASGKVSLTRIVDDDGSTVVGAGLLGVTLVNVEEERVGMNQVPYSKPVNGQIIVRNPEVKLNLYVLFSSNPGDIHYLTSLKLISLVVKFFQARNDFTPKNSPRLDPGIQHLKFDLYSLPIEQQNYLWGGLGGKYLPSVMYKVRLISIMEDEALSSGPAITTIETQIS